MVALVFIYRGKKFYYNWTNLMGQIDLLLRKIFILLSRCYNSNPTPRFLLVYDMRFKNLSNQKGVGWVGGLQHTTAHPYLFLFICKSCKHSWDVIFLKMNPMFLSVLPQRLSLTSREKKCYILIKFIKNWSILFKPLIKTQNNQKPFMSVNVCQ